VQKIPNYRIIIVILIPLIFIFSGQPLHFILQIPPINLVGSGGEPYSREAAIWIRDNVSPEGVFLTLDTRTANVIKYYSNNDALALHANRNPAYTQVDNPDEFILNGKISYLVYDVYLSEKLRYLKEETKELNELITKYNATPIYTEYNTGTENNGKNSTKPALIIYSLNGIEEN
jgi:hypothetical protein